MNIFLSIIDKHTSNSSNCISANVSGEKHLEPIVIEAFRKFFPVRDFENEVGENLHSRTKGRVSSWIASNEGMQGTNFTEKCGFEYVKLGYSDCEFYLVFRDGYIDSNYLEKASGCFSLIKLNEHGIEVVTDAVGSHPLFFRCGPLYNSFI